MTDAERTQVVAALTVLSNGKRAYVRWDQEDTYIDAGQVGGWTGYLGEPNELGTYFTLGHRDPDDALLSLLRSVSEDASR